MGPQTQRRAKDGNQPTPAGVAVLEVGGQQEPSGDRGWHGKFLLGLAAESLLESLQTWKGSRSALRALRLPARQCGEERGCQVWTRLRGAEVLGSGQELFPGPSLEESHLCSPGTNLELL